MDVLNLTPEQAAEAERLFQILQPAVEAELRQLTRLLASKPDQHLLGKTEFEVRDRVHKIGAKAIEAALNERKKGGYQGSSLSCPSCHGPSKFQDRRDKTFLSLMGEVVVEDRAYYLCPACHAGHAPVDAALGLSARKLTPGAEELATLAGTVGSFAEAAEKLLPRMAGLRLSESTVERTTEAAGERLGALWAEGHTLGRGAGWRWNRDARGRTIAYVSVDATGVGIQGEGGAKAEGRMAWVGKVFNPRPEPTEASPKPHPPSARYLAGLMGLDELGERMRRQAAQVGMGRAERWVALTDGGNGLDDLMDVFFPRAVRILDFYHAAEHLGDLAKAYCGGEATAAEERAERWAHQMKQEGGGAILATLEALDLSGRSAATLEAHRQVTGYVRNNLHRMDYRRYRQEGWQIGSGHIEAACKTVVNQRLKQSGMRWGGDGADALCHLRALYADFHGRKPPHNRTVVR